MLSRGNALKRIGSGLVPKDGIEPPSRPFQAGSAFPPSFFE